MNEKLTIGKTKSTVAILKKYGLHAKKGFGQNFLTDVNILQKIVAAANIRPTDNVIEIGPGLGALTQQLATKAGQVLAVEIDHELIGVLHDLLADVDNVKVIEGDVMQLDLPATVKDQFADPHRPVKVVANLPYYITTPILMKLLESPVKWAAICVMMQKEVADRLVASPGSKDYGALTLAVAHRMDARIAFPVSRRVFVPSPKVDSAIVVLTPRQAAIDPQPVDQAKLFMVIRTCFGHRRKNLRNNLRSLVGKDKEKLAMAEGVLAEIGVSSSQRPGELSLGQYSALTNGLISKNLI